MDNFKIWCLQVAVNDYNQWGEYTVAFFTQRPSLEALTQACSKGFGDFGYPHVNGLSREASLERLLKDGFISEMPKHGGGDKWYLCEFEVTNG